MNGSIECRTNLTSSNDQSVGNWTDPNGVKISTDTVNVPFAILRGPGVIYLFRFQSLGTMEGIYTCEIPDTNGVVYKQYIGLYTDENYNNGECRFVFASFFCLLGKPIFSSLPTFTLQTSLSEFPPSFSITCTSSTFPPTFVNWTRDGQLLETGRDLFSTSQVPRA